MTHDVFVSYSTKDQQVADEIIQYLETMNVTCWIASQDIQGGEKWLESILTGISNSQALILLLSAEAQKSKWVLDELLKARELDKIIIPFRLDNSYLRENFKFVLQQIQWTNLFPDPIENYYDEIQASIEANLEILEDEVEDEVENEDEDNKFIESFGVEINYYVKSVLVHLKSMVYDLDTNHEGDIVSLTLKCNVTDLIETKRLLYKFDSLQMLSLKDNDLDSIPLDFTNFSFLEKLDLKNNRLLHLTEDIIDLVNLRELDISNNSLEILPNSINKLNKLEILDLSNNSLNELPDSISDLGNLKILKLNNNNLETLPSTIERLRQLRDLELNNNAITSLPSNMARLKITYIDIGNNPLSINGMAEIGEKYIKHIPPKFWGKQKEYKKYKIQIRNDIRELINNLS